ncbi:hypothetical protein FA95DRAFT_1500276 [Auriscalpium vulgare]|uniref:Uncharacterized protein n=1 Tax=Auriscalpium vulgare TaxID=40419 RepID=A0ACB8REE8_9AGAM|nr:hypothetical protein FA95DRAFT_1500276 [Auriscalpium vulgare]
MPSQVDFPSTDAGAVAPPMPQQRPPHLPFRRISLPSAPNLMLDRQSVVSMASFDSLPEEGSTPGSAAPRSPARKPKSRPTSMDQQRRAMRRREVRLPNEQRDAKRRKVIEEFYETERTYVEGLDLIYSHFLTPIIASLDTPQPLLDRSELTSVFSNFIDIWNLHRAFFSSLHEHLHPPTSSSSTLDASVTPPPLSPILLSHFPYLSLYTPFVTSFHTSVSSLTGLLTSNAAFSTFLARQEADPRCGRLKLRDWLLTIVQRCPRYLLLLKDLIGCTDESDPERSSLMAAHSLVSKITVSLNTSLHTHAQTLALLGLQRSTPNLPFQLIAPGRTFLKRGSLLQFERGSFPKERDFLLFSDSLIWLANLDKGDNELAERWDYMAGVGMGKGRPSGARPPMLRSRSRSEAELSVMRNRLRDSPASRSAVSPISPTSPVSAPAMRPSASAASVLKMKKRQASSGAGEEKWWFKGRAELVDLEVVVTPAAEVGEETRFEILSPEGSFAVYAATEEERDEWTTAIRNAKASLLVSLHVTNPNSTLTSSASTNHIRRTLQALPHLPEEDARQPKRGKVEHFVPAVWIPDGKTESCMRCGRTFGWRRRRHHCRLCGRCVCASCSGSTFFISESNSKDTGKPARACDACYETVFPVITPSASPHVPSVTPTFSLSHFPSWHSTPALSIPMASRPPSLLMAIDRNSPKRPLARIEDLSDVAPTPVEGGDDGPSHPVIRIRPASRPRSFHHILEDFRDESLIGAPSPATSHFSAHTEESADAASSTHPHHTDGDTDADPPISQSFGSQLSSEAAGPSPQYENTVRRAKRFSLPAVGLQTTPVTARANATGDGLAKRFSLVLGGRGAGSRTVRAKARDEGGSPGTLKHGAAAVKLSELLGRRKSAAAS